MLGTCIQLSTLSSPCNFHNVHTKFCGVDTSGLSYEEGQDSAHPFEESGVSSDSLKHSMEGSAGSTETSK